MIRDGPIRIFNYHKFHLKKKAYFSLFLNIHFCVSGFSLSSGCKKLQKETNFFRSILLQKCKQFQHDELLHNFIAEKVINYIFILSKFGEVEKPIVINVCNLKSFFPPSCFAMPHFVFLYIVRIQCQIK